MKRGSSEGSDRVVFVMNANDKIISVANDFDDTARFWLYDFFNPEIERVIKIDIG